MTATMLTARCFDAADGDGHLALWLAVWLVRQGRWPGLPTVPRERLLVRK